MSLTRVRMESPANLTSAAPAFRAEPADGAPGVSRKDQSYAQAIVPNNEIKRGIVDIVVGRQSSTNCRATVPA